MRWKNLAGLIVTASLEITMAGAAFADSATPRQSSVLAPRAESSILIDLAWTGKRFVAVGERGHVLLSDDGQDWRQVVSPVSRMLNAVFFINESTGWAVGYDFAIIKTTDGGETWQPLNYEADPGWAFYDVFFLDTQHGYALGERGSFRRTRDGGQSWEDIETDLTELGMHINAMTRLGNGQLVIVGEKGLTARSTDNGETWQMLTEPYVGSFFGVLPHGNSGFVAYGLRGNTYLVEDVDALVVQDPLQWDEYGRETVEDPDKLAELGWQVLDNPVNESLFGGTTLRSGDIVLVGVNGSVARSDYAGKRMVQLDNPRGVTLGDAVLKNGELILVGAAGIQRLSIRQAEQRGR